MNNKLIRKMFFSINRGTLFLFFVYLCIVAAGIAGVIYSGEFGDEYKYFFVSPSAIKNDALSWTTGVWGGVLGIHGTIAALSITFMGMFVSQVSEYSEHGFENVCKSLLLRKTSFLRFSLNSILTLLTGIVLISCGGGLISYAISICVSLFFIFSYGLMYLRLYNVTENPGVIADSLFIELQESRRSQSSIDELTDSLKNNFLGTIQEFEFIHFGWGDYLNKEQENIDIFPVGQNVVISDFCPVCFREINEILRSHSNDFHFSLNVFISFMYPLSNSSVSVEVDKGKMFDPLLLNQVKKMLRKGLVFSPMPESIINHGKYESAVLDNLRNSIITGNDVSLDFGVKALFALVNEKDLVNTINSLGHSFRYQHKKSHIDYTVFSALYLKIDAELRGGNDSEIASKILKSIIDLARFVYTNEVFYYFYKMISPSLGNHARYGFRDDERHFFDLYAETIRDNILSKNFMALELNTDFIANEVRYLTSSDDEESLSKIESKMISCIKQVVTLLIIRLLYLKNNYDKYEDEIKAIRICLRKWLVASFFEDIYYNKNVYDILFFIPSEPDFNASRTLRDIPDYSVSSVSIASDTYKAICLIMTQSSFNKNNLSTAFIRNVKGFLKNTGITTHELQSIVDYLRSDDFKVLLDLIEEDSSDGSNRIKIAESLEAIIVAKNEMIVSSIVNAELDTSLVDAYIEKVSASLGKYFSRILDTNIIPLTDSTANETLYSLINKREVLPSLDGVHYSMNSGYQAEKTVYGWLHKVLDKVKVKTKRVQEIDSLNELPSDKLVTILYMVKGEVGIYRYSKGISIADSEGKLELGEPGLYYIDVNNEFSCQKGSDLFEVNIEEISDGNVSLVRELYDLNDENPFMYALLSIRINLSLVTEGHVTLYYLSVENCRKLIGLHEKNTRLSLDGKDSQDDFTDYP